ncbi:MAG: NADH-quinone oxidoreductase subunit M, partial [Halieaceae bacterium]
MELANLIVILFFGGILAWLAELLISGSSRWVSLVTLTVAALYLWRLVSGIPAEQFALDPVAASADTWLLHAKLAWIPRFGVSFELAMDGLSLLLVALTLFLGVVAVVSSWSEIDHHQGFFQANLLWTLCGVVGVFLALDLFLFFLFWEVMLIPMYLLIAIWGHEGKAHAAMKFFIFTQVSGLLMLLSIVVLVVV